MTTLNASFNKNNCRCFWFHVQRCNHPSIAAVRGGALNFSRFLLLDRRHFPSGARYASQTCFEEGLRYTSFILCVRSVWMDIKTSYLQVSPGESISITSASFWFVHVSYVAIGSTVFCAVWYGNAVRHSAIGMSMSCFFNWVFDRNTFPTQKGTVGYGYCLFRCIVRRICSLFWHVVWVFSPGVLCFWGVYIVFIPRGRWRLGGRGGAGFCVLVL